MQAIADSTPSEEDLVKESRIHQALGDPVRLKIMYLLSEQTLCVCALKAMVDMPDSKLSYHLGVLKEAGLIEGKREGSWMIYSTCPSRVKITRK